MSHFNPEQVQVSAARGDYKNLTHGKSTITFKLKDALSNTGIFHNAKYKTNSIAVTVPEKLHKKLNALLERIRTFAPDATMKSLTEDGALFLKLKPDQVDKSLMKTPVSVDAVFTITALYNDEKVIMRTDKIKN